MALKKWLTKTYTFTDTEILAMREALIEYNQHIKGLKPKSPIFKKIHKAVEGLKEQFKRDYSLLYSK